MSCWLLLPLLLACRGEVASSPAQQTAPPSLVDPTEPETVLERLPLLDGLDLTLATDPRRFAVELLAQDYLEIEVAQRGIDVAVTVTGPDGNVILTADSPNGPAGIETVAVVATGSGRHIVRIDPSFDPLGREIRLEPIAHRPATEADGQFAEILGRYFRYLAGNSAQERQHRFEEQSRDLEQLAGQDRPLLTGRIERALGLLCLEEGRVRDALEHLERALPRIRAHSNDWELTALLNDTGYAARLAGKPQQARESFKESLRRADDLGNDLAAATALNNLGVLSEALGELESALDFYDLSAGRWRRLSRLKNLATTLHNIGLTYVSLGRLNEARDHLEQALVLRRREVDTRGEALTLASIGWVRSLEGDHDLALDLFDQSLELQRALGDPGGEAATLDQRGSALRALGRDEEAITDFERALSLLDDGGNRVIEAHLLANLGEALLAVGRPLEALASQHSALALFRAVDDLQGEARALIDLAAVERRRGRSDIALAHYERAFELIESIRGRLQSTGFRRSFFAARYDAYSDYIDLLIELDADEPQGRFGLRAFHALERARARSLRERLDAGGQWWRGADPALLADEEDLRERINLLESLRFSALESGTDGDALAGIELKIETLTGEYEKLEGRLRSSTKPVASPPQALTLEQIQASLDAETTMLVYHLGEQEVGWLVEHDRFHRWAIERAPRTVTTDILAARARSTLALSGSVGHRAQAEADVAALAGRVLPPVEGELERRVVVVATGALATIPFSALPIGSKEESAPQRLLVEDHEVAYLPSASVLPLLRDRRPPTKLLAVLADPIFATTDERVEAPRPAVSRGPESDRLQRLPYSGAEAEAIFDLASGCVAEPSHCLKWTGAEATRGAVLEGKLAKFQLIHFATHGWIDDRHPALSGIVLSRFDAAGQPQDGFLRAYEIERLDLTADLVVLSACQTALGDTVRGEGVVGMAQAFFRAGARRLVVSHWQVDDHATAALMERFYRHLLVDGQPPATALANAQRWMMHETPWKAPYFWGAFALQGDWR